jgi:hypothetical protein
MHADATIETIRPFCSDSRIGTSEPLAWKGHLYACDGRALLRIPSNRHDELPARQGDLFAMAFLCFPPPVSFAQPAPPLYRVEEGRCVFCRGIAKGPCDFCGGTRLNFAGPYDQLAGVSVAYGYAYLLRRLPDLRVAAGVPQKALTEGHLAFTFTGGQGLLACIKE